MHTPKADVVHTTGHIFPDGTVFELIRNSNRDTMLIRWKDEKFELGDCVEFSGKTYAPAPIAPSIPQVLRLPARIGPPESTEILFGDLHAFFTSLSCQLESCVTPLVYAVFTSWLSAVLPIAPIFSIFAPPGSPKTRMLQLLRMVCRRPLCVVALRRSDMLRLPWSLGPTLLLDEPDLSSAMQTILRASSQRNMHVAAGRGIVDLFGTKIIVTSNPSYEALLDGNVLRVALMPVSGTLPPLEKSKEEQIAEEFQARCLGYFFAEFQPRPSTGL